jgi:hypothetical protein
MTLPRLYKYLDVNGAKLTLGNRTFRHAKPSTFRDLEDMTIRSVFPEEVDVAVAKLSEGCVDVIVENAEVVPTCSPKLAEAVKGLQKIFLEDPRAGDAVKEQIKELNLFDVEQMRAMSEAFVEDTKEFMQGYRILCVSSDNASERMWEDYAQDHEGILLRIEPNSAKGSKFELFRPVIYRRSRPALYEQTLDFIKGCLFDDQQARTRAILDKIIYAKTLPYKFENEYRLAIRSDMEGDWEMLPYHPEEITELYLGLAMTKADRIEIAGKAKAVNPKMSIFQGSRDPGRKLTFKPIAGV